MTLAERAVMIDEVRLFHDALGWYREEHDAQRVFTPGEREVLRFEIRKRVWDLVGPQQGEIEV